VSGEPPAHSPEMPPGGWERPLAEAPPQHGPFASWGRRAAAWLLDLLILLVPAAVAIALLTNALIDTDAAIVTWILSVLLSFLVLFVLFVIYGPLTMVRRGGRNGQTLGKQLVGIRVVREDGRPVDFGTAVLREAVLKQLALGIASSVVPVVPFLVDYLWPLIDDRNQALHDLVVSTLVVEA
jgi:uncharacterized RDD family membrane protein YckC